MKFNTHNKYSVQNKRSKPQSNKTEITRKQYFVQSPFLVMRARTCHGMKS